MTIYYGAPPHTVVSIQQVSTVHKSVQGLLHLGFSHWDVAQVQTLLKARAALSTEISFYQVFLFSLQNFEPITLLPLQLQSYSLWKYNAV